jgi:hypothetical protein
MSQFGNSEICKFGYWAVPHKATRRSFTCHICKQSIDIGMNYYAMVRSCGVQPYPEKVHVNCLDDYYKELEELNVKWREKL